jgi:hypothetical protein
MPVPWEKHVQETGQLKVFVGPTFLGAAAWGAGMATRILNEFNSIAAANRLGVRLVQSTDEPKKDGTGADVRLDASSGTCRFFNSTGGDETGSLPTTPGDIRGRCFSVIVTHPNNLDFNWKAFVFVPVDPSVFKHLVGEPVRIAIALHEFLHACGLREADPGHGTPGNPPSGDLDFFATNQVMIEGVTPDKDRMFISGKLVPNSAGQFTITPRTASLVQRVWLLGQF